ncbi:MAG TPA: VanZ family protein [Bacteroidales bacterium]|nr:VanZ family protein [Bacteroidales bacterium]
MRLFLRYNRWAILWGSAILLLMLLPGSTWKEFPGFFKQYQLDKLLHLFLFGGFSWLQARALRAQPVYPRLQRHAFLMTFLIALKLGAGTELVQEFFIPFRTGSLVDLAANITGTLIGLWLVWRRGES